MALGQRYNTDRIAAEALRMGRSTLKRYIANPNMPEYFYLPEEPYGETPIFGKQGDGPSVLFNSIKEAVEAGYATNTQNARRKIKRQEEGWRYAHFNENGTSKREPYTLKPGEMSYEQYKNTINVVALESATSESSF